MKEKGEEMKMQAFFNKMTALNLSNSIFVDCTSSADVTAFYERYSVGQYFDRHPNKKANSASMERITVLKTTAFKRGVKFFYETNVGAGFR